MAPSEKSRPRPIRVLAVIPARGGSRGLPGKNILPLCGVPMIVHTIRHARTSRTIDRAVVSTDSAKIAAVARRAGCDVVRRPARLATARASVVDALRHVLGTLLRREGVRPEIVVLLAPNVPVRPAGVVDRCVRLLRRSGADAALTVTPTGKFHPAWMLERAGDRLVLPRGAPPASRQMLSPRYLHDGAAIAVRAARLLAPPAHRGLYSAFGRDLRAVVLAPGDAIEIDDRIDLHVAEAVMREKRGR